MAGSLSPGGRFRNSRDGCLRGVGGGPNPTDSTPIGSYHGLGSTANMRVALAALAACLDRLGRYDPAAAITGFAVSPYTATIDQARMELNAVSK